MAHLLETPSRVIRRIEAAEDFDMPSLPSLPAFEDSANHISSDLPNPIQSDTDDSLDLSNSRSLIHSTPAVSNYNASTARPRSTASNLTGRFGTSIARSGRSSGGFSSASRPPTTKNIEPNSYDITGLPSLPNIQPERATDHFSEEDLEESKESVPEAYLPPDDDEDGEPYSLAEALQSVSITGSPYGKEVTPRYVDYVVPLPGSDRKVCHI